MPSRAKFDPTRMVSAEFVREALLRILGHSYPWSVEDVRQALGELYKSIEPMYVAAALGTDGEHMKKVMTGYQTFRPAVMKKLGLNIVFLPDKAPEFEDVFELVKGFVGTVSNSGDISKTDILRIEKIIGRKLSKEEAEKVFAL